MAGAAVRGEPDVGFARLVAHGRDLGVGIHRLAIARAAQIGPRENDLDDARRAGLDQITYQVFADPQSMVAQFEAGALDLADTIPLRDAVRLQKDAKYQVLYNNNGGGLWNWTGFDSPELRSIGESIQAEPDPAKLRQLTDRWNDYVLDQCTVLGIATIVPRCAMAQRVHGIAYDMFTSLNGSGAWLD
jgi:ABC-type transport system substrate-binding protein